MIYILIYEFCGGGGVDKLFIAISESFIGGSMQISSRLHYIGFYIRLHRIGRLH